MKNVNWAVVWSLLRTLLVAGGPVATLLIALDFPPVLVGKWMAIGLAFVGVASIVGPGLKGAFTHTNEAKMASVAAMSDVDKTAAVAAMPAPAQAAIAQGLPDEVKIAAVTSLPDVAQVLTHATATNGVAKAAADPAQPKVVSL